jgi:TRAP-type C4-dicarboxylate transport system permease small subunit
MANRLANAIARLFGVAMVGLAILVTVETLARKFIGLSLQGVDELGGYALAVTSSLAFTLALIDRAHIRIDLLHNMLPGFAQRLLNWLSIVVLAALALLLAWTGWLALDETIEFRSTAPTPWATPLVWPQLAWFAGCCCSRSRALRHSSTHRVSSSSVAAASWRAATAPRRSRKRWTRSWLTCANDRVTKCRYSVWPVRSSSASLSC